MNLATDLILQQAHEVLDQFKNTTPQQKAIFLHRSSPSGIESITE